MATITWLRHASVLIEGEKRIYIDPWEIRSPKEADLVLITHDHYDHLSMTDLKRICRPSTEILLPEGSVKKIAGVHGRIHGVKPGQELIAAGLRVEVVAAYNLSKHFHPKAANNVGYIVTVDGERIYHAGDSDRIPEMKGLKPDVALLPIGGTYTMDPSEAAKAASDLQAKKAIPIHFGAIIGGKEEAELFKKVCPVPVEILEPTEKES
jgi:L-ascorbate metabolism protein UlaG (beta-lactamase superfamily)